MTSGTVQKHRSPISGKFELEKISIITAMQAKTKR
jgi:hypothetical protein